MSNTQEAKLAEFEVKEALNVSKVLESLKQQMIEADPSFSKHFTFLEKEFDPTNTDFSSRSKECAEESAHNEVLRNEYEKEKARSAKREKANVFALLASAIHRREVLEPQYKTEFLSRAHKQNETVRQIAHEMEVTRLQSSFAQREFMNLMRDKGLSGDQKRYEEALVNPDDTRLADSIKQMRAAQQRMFELERKAEDESKLSPELAGNVFETIREKRARWEEELAAVMDSDIEIPDGSAFLDALKSIFKKEDAAGNSMSMGA